MEEGVSNAFRSSYRHVGIDVRAFMTD